MVANMSPPADGQSSIDSEGRIPAASMRPVSGRPKPIFSSTSGLIDTEQPASASIASWWSEMPLPCTMVVRSSSSPRSRMSAIGRRPLGQPVAPCTCTLTHSPSSRASATSAAVVSIVVSCGPRRPSIMASSGSCDRTRVISGAMSGSAAVPAQ
jgi:hypothetical protein